LPHLWQKRASGGSSAPQVQNSGMFKFSVPQALEAAQGEAFYGSTR
jgi:hypothetical protein